MVDGMLGSLARKLRMYGFDTLYKAELSDTDLIKIANVEKRILLTADRELFARAVNSNVDSVLAADNSDTERLASIFKDLKISVELDAEKSRCAVCNGVLDEADKSSLKALPNTVLERQEKFYACKNCGKVYWKGSHWRRIEAMAKEVSKKVAQT